jgi:hypothetical protein
MGYYSGYRGPAQKHSIPDLIIMTKRLNLDELVSESKVLTLGGKQFDVTRMPLAIYIMIIDQAKTDQGITLEFYQKALTTWLQSIDTTITSDWVIEKTNDVRMLVSIRDNLFNVSSDPLPGWTSDDTSPTMIVQSPVKTS